MAHTLRVPHPQHGHVCTTWEVGTASEEEVRTAFDELVSHGLAGATATYEDGTEEVWIGRTFDPQAKTITLVPHLAGG